MTIQPNVAATITVGAETTFGTPAATSLVTAQRMRRVSSSLAGTKAAFASNEVRGDQQVSDVRHGTFGVAGGIQGELSTVSYDLLLAGLMRSTWGAAVTMAHAVWTTPNVAFTVLGSGVYRATFGASGGSLITVGFRVGDIVRFTALPAGPAATSLLNKYLRITALTATTMDFTFTNADLTLAAAPTQATFTLEMVGRKISNGILKPSFTIEQSYDDIDVSELFSGVRVGGGSFRVAPNGNATVGFDFAGRKPELMQGATAPYFTSPIAEGTTGIVNGIGGSIRVAGVDRAIVTGFDVNVNLNLSAPPVIGPRYVPEIFYGRSVVTGMVTAFLEDASLIAAFLNETEVDISALVTGALDNADFLAFNMQRVKLMGAQKQIGPEGGVIVQFPYQATLKSGTGFDTGTLTIQRSNAV